MANPPLLAGERVWLSTRRHLATLVLPLLGLLIGSAGLTLADCQPLWPTVDGACPAATSGAAGTAAAVLVLDWYGTVFVLTDQRLIEWRLPLWRRTRSLRLVAIESLLLEQGVVGRVVGFGSVAAGTAATLGSEIVLDAVPDPEIVHSAIAAAIERAQR